MLKKYVTIIILWLHIYLIYGFIYIYLNIFGDISNFNTKKLIEMINIRINDILFNATNFCSFIRRLPCTYSVCGNTTESENQ